MDLSAPEEGAEVRRIKAYDGKKKKQQPRMQKMQQFEEVLHLLWGMRESEAKHIRGL